jgi:PAS domain S-box-containing protein
MIKILVIDHAGSCRGIRKVLPETGIPGFKINFTTSYRDILEGFRETAYDVCVIDSAAGNGPKLFAQARSLGYAAPVILVISNDSGEAVNAIRSGVADCLIRDDMTAAGIERLICSVVEQAKASAQQNERAQRYLALIDNADEIIFTHDLKGNLTSMNTAGEQLVGYAQDEWLSQPVSKIVGYAHREVAQQTIQQTLDTRRQASCEIEIVTSQGERVLVDASLHLVYQQGEAVEVQWVARDLHAPNRSAAGFFRNAHLHKTSRSSAQRLSA